MNKTTGYQGSSVFYQVEGEGHPVIFLHGFAEDGSIWDHQAHHLKKKFRLIIPDLPGSGQSAFNPQLSTIEDHADCIKAIADAENAGGCILIGHSLGGYISLAFAEKYPDYLKGLGLFHSTAFPDTPEKKEARKKSIEFIRQHGAYPFIRQSIPNLFSENFKKQQPQIVELLIQRYANFNPGSLVSYYEAMIKRPDRRQVLKDAGYPILFIIGEQDKAVPLSDSLKQCYLPQLSYIHILENTAHMGMLESTLYCNNILEAFLSQAFQ